MMNIIANLQLKLHPVQHNRQKRKLVIRLGFASDVVEMPVWALLTIP